MWAKIGSAAALIALHAAIYLTGGLYSLLASLSMCACLAAMKHARDSRASAIRNVCMWSAAAAVLIVLTALTAYDWRHEKLNSAMPLFTLTMGFTLTLMGHRFTFLDPPEKADDKLPDGERV